MGAGVTPREGPSAPSPALFPELTSALVPVSHAVTTFRKRGPPVAQGDIDFYKR